MHRLRDIARSVILGELRAGPRTHDQLAAAVLAAGCGSGMVGVATWGLENDELITRDGDGNYTTRTNR